MIFRTIEWWPLVGWTRCERYRCARPAKRHNSSGHRSGVCVRFWIWIRCLMYGRGCCDLGRQGAAGGFAGSVGVWMGGGYFFGFGLMCFEMWNLSFFNWIVIGLVLSFCHSGVVWYEFFYRRK